MGPPWFSLFVLGLSPQSLGFSPSPAHLEFVVDKVAVGQIILRIISTPRVSIILPMIHNIHSRIKSQHLTTALHKLQTYKIK